MIIHPSSPRLELFQRLESLYVSGMANASSVHWAGQISKKLLANARKQIAQYFQVNANTVFFTSSWHEYFRIIISGRAEYQKRSGNDNSDIIIITLQNLPSKVMDVFYSRNPFLNVRFIPFESQAENRLSFLVKMKQYQPEYSVVLITLMNDTITMFNKKDLEEIITFCRDRQYLLWLDVTDSLYHYHSSFLELSPYFDFITFNHTGTGSIIPSGVIIKKSSVHLAAQTFGGSQERGLRTGTENLLGAIFLGEAISLIQKR